MGDDFRYAWRAWTASLRHHTSTWLIIVTLALGVGAASAIFGLVDSLLRLLPFPAPDRLVMLWEGKADEGPARLRVAWPDFQDWRAQNRSFAGLAVFYPDYSTVRTPAGAERLRSTQADAGFFAVVGCRIARGRAFDTGDLARHDAVVMLSERVWRSRFASWPEPVGRSVLVDGAARKVIGIVSQGEEFPRSADLWVPFVPTHHHAMRGGHSLLAVGRLRPGVSLAQARTEMDTIAARLARQYPDSNAQERVAVVPLADELTGDIKPAVRVLGAATVALLLMACVSVANVLFARGLDRGPELAVRKALGANRGRVIVQLLIEGGLSALAAGLAGLLMVGTIQRVLLGIAPNLVPRDRQPSLDGRVIGFAVALAILTVFVFGLLPALRVTGGSLMPYFRGGRGSRMDGASQRLRRGLTVVSVGVAFMLLVASLLLMRSLGRLQGVEPGFRPRHVLSVQLGLPAKTYVTPREAAEFYAALLAHLRGLPGVTAAGAVDSLPLTGSSEGRPYQVVGKPRARAGEDPIVRVSTATPGYFAALGIPLLRGRDFSLADGPDAHVVLINQTMARACWPGADAIGKHLKLGNLDAPGSHVVIGEVLDTRDDGLGAAAPARVYLNHREYGDREMTLAIRTTNEPGGLVGAVRGEVQRMDGELPVYGVMPVADLLQSSLARSRLVLFVVGAFSLLALLLASVGVYGVLLTSLVQRTKEFGIRIALGCRLGGVAWLVAREGFLLVALGLGAGLVAAVAASRLLESLLFGVGRMDPSSYLGAALVVLGVIALGCLALLRHLGRMEPVDSLRND